MKLKLLPYALVVILTSASSVQAQFTWTGLSSINGNATAGLNWLNADLLTFAPNGLGGENVIFGDITLLGQTHVLVPTSAFQNITFNGSNRPAYTLSGDGESTPTLLLSGDVTAGAGGNILFDSSLNLALTDTLHSIDVTGTQVRGFQRDQRQQRKYCQNRQRLSRSQRGQYVHRRPESPGRNAFSRQLFDRQRR